jgi:hypothetical protein
MFLWNVYQTCRQMRLPASTHLQIPSSQPWTQYMVNTAIARFGLWAEAKLRETDDKCRQRWTAEQVLGEVPVEKQITPIEAAGESVAAWLDELGGSF